MRLFIALCVLQLILVRCQPGCDFSQYGPVVGVLVVF
jgi:hypothetical protein